MNEVRLGAALAMLMAGCGRIGFEPTRDAGPCPPGYTPLGAGCYRLDGIESPRGWLDAEQACERDVAGAHLVVLDDAAEQAVVADFADPVMDYWIGVTDQASEGSFVAVNGQADFYLVWATDAPSGEAEDCVMVLGDAALDDAPCTGVNQYVCEYDGVAAARRPRPPAAASAMR